MSLIIARRRGEEELNQKRIESGGHSKIYIVDEDDKNYSYDCLWQMISDGVYYNIFYLNDLYIFSKVIYDVVLNYLIKENEKEVDISEMTFALLTEHEEACKNNTPSKIKELVEIKLKSENLQTKEDLREYYYRDELRVIEKDIARLKAKEEEMWFRRGDIVYLKKDIYIHKKYFKHNNGLEITCVYPERESYFCRVKIQGKFDFLEIPQNEFISPNIVKAKNIKPEEFEASQNK